MRTYSSFCGTVCSDSTGTVTSDAAVRLHRRYHIIEKPLKMINFATVNEGRMKIDNLNIVKHLIGDTEGG